MKSLNLTLILFLLYLELGATINKKQTFCQQDQCLSCVGRYCTTTCEGETCKNCPLGDCCDGSSCNICRGEKCCATAECNSCVIGCLKQCQNVPTCHYDCFQRCLPGGDPNGGGEQSGNYTGTGGTGSLITNRNYLPVNVTTTINITNTIRNENFLHNPIYVNTTNINNHTGYQNFHNKQVIINTKNEENTTEVVTEQPKANCCEVVHPERCKKLRDQKDLLCYIKKHNECSRLCSSDHVHIIEDANEKHNCVAIEEQPFWYCGHYRIENCNSCYNETESEEIEVTSEDCSEACKSGIIGEAFYNKLFIRDV